MEYDATLIGSDPDTDLALLKVKADNLPSIAIGNSDSVRIANGCLLWVIHLIYLQPLPQVS